MNSDCDDGNACTTDTCTAGACSNVNNCGGSTVQIDATSVRGACAGESPGTNPPGGDTITLAGVPVGSQANRILIVSVGAEEDNGDCNLSLASVTYGGAPMTLAKSELSGLNNWRACNGIFYLLNPPTGSANVIVNFPTTVAGTIDNRRVGAYRHLQRGQTAPASTAGAGTATPIR